MKRLALFTFAMLACCLLAPALLAQNASTALSQRGLEVRSQDFGMRMSSWVSFRFTHQQEVANGQDGTNGRNFNNFRVRNAKTTFRGHIYDRNFQYRVTFNWVAGGNDLVERVYFRYSLMPAFNIAAGQTKPEWNWEYNIGAGYQMFTDRGYANSKYNQNYAKGVWADGRIGDDAPLLKYHFGVYNGVLRADDDFRNRDRAITADSFRDGRVDTSPMLNLRLETHPLGEVSRTMYDLRSAEEFNQPLVAAGFGVNYLSGGFNNEHLREDTSGREVPASGRSRTRHETWSVTADLNARWQGLSLHVAVYWRHTEFKNRGSNDADPSDPSRSGIRNMSDVATVVEANYAIIPGELVAGVRWNHLDADEFWGNGSQSQERAVWPDVHEVGVAVSWFIRGEALRVTADVTHVSQQLAFAYDGSDSLRGAYNSPPTRGAFGGSGGSDYNNLWIARVQLQWMF
jgi:hypothetical protein